MTRLSSNKYKQNFLGFGIDSNLRGEVGAKVRSGRTMGWLWKCKHKANGIAFYFDGTIYIVGTSSQRGLGNLKRFRFRENGMW